MCTPSPRLVERRDNGIKSLCFPAPRGQEESATDPEIEDEEEREKMGSSSSWGPHHKRGAPFLLPFVAICDFSREERGDDYDEGSRGEGGRRDFFFFLSRRSRPTWSLVAKKVFSAITQKRKVKVRRTTSNKNKLFKMRRGRPWGTGDRPGVDPTQDTQHSRSNLRH